MPATVRPHISSALQHLRLGVSGAGAILSLALLAQMILWAVVHFTDIRTQELHAPATSPAALKVIVHEPPASVPAGRSLAPPESMKHPKQAATHTGEPATAKNINVVATGNDIRLRKAAGLVQTVGVIAALILALLAFQGVIVAGGSGVPGVEHAVTACMWTLIIAFAAIPLGSIIPGVPYSGAFAPYDSIVHESDAYRMGGDSAPGGLAFFGLHMGVPLLLIAAVGSCVLRFRAGVEQGIIITNVSQLDERIEQEIRSRSLGELSRPRAIAALNQAIGVTPANAAGASVAPSPRQAPPRSPGMMPPRAANPLGASLTQGAVPAAQQGAGNARPLANPQQQTDNPGATARPI